MPLVPIQLAHAAPAGPPAAPPDSPQWGQQATFDHWRHPIIADSVDSISAGTQEERARMRDPSARGRWALPRELRRLVTNERIGVRTAERDPLPPPYLTEVRNNDRSYARPKFTLRYRDPKPIADLFNHPGGMRGHYFVSAAAGDTFAQDLITLLLPLLLGVMSDWRALDPFPGTWFEQDEATVRASLLEGKVWMTEPWAAAGMLTDHGRGNPHWLPRTDARSVERRRGFIAAVRAAEGGDAASTAAFLDSATNKEGLLGRDENLGGVDTWRAQDAGASFMGTEGTTTFYTVEIKGAFVNAQGQTWTPLRKKYNALSLHWLGFS